MAADEVADEAPWWQARKLLRAARAGTLASSAAGQPFASLITPACTPDLTLLLWLSGLSEHTRHLRAEPRCAVMVVGAAATDNPQTASRLTVTGLAEPIDDPVLKARWLALHPYAALYAEFADFALWRVRPQAAVFIGGFARAYRLKLREFLPDPAAAAAVAAAEAEIVGHCNADHADAMAAIGAIAGGAIAGGVAAGEVAGDWRMVAADLDGADLALGERVVRVAWRAPVAGPDTLRTELIRLARAARAARAG